MDSVTLEGNCNICRLVQHKLIQDGRLQCICLRHVDGIIPDLMNQGRKKKGLFYISHVGKQLFIKDVSSGQVYSGGLSHWTVPLKPQVYQFFQGIMGLDAPKRCPCGSAGLILCNKCTTSYCTKCVKMELDKFSINQKQHHEDYCFICPLCKSPLGINRTMFQGLFEGTAGQV